MGYQYLGDGLQYSVDGKRLNWHGWKEKSHAPMGPDDPPQWALFSDWVYQWIEGTQWMLRKAGHAEGGGGVTHDLVGITTTGSPIDPAGGNQLFNDGSARWVDFSEMQPVWSIGVPGQTTVRQWWLYR